MLTWLLAFFDLTLVAAGLLLIASSYYDTPAYILGLMAVLFVLFRSRARVMGRIGAVLLAGLAVYGLATG